MCAGWASEGFEMLEANDPILKIMCANVPVTQAVDTVDALTAIFNALKLDYFRVLVCIFPQDIGSSVSRTIIDKYNFKITDGLGQQRINALSDIR
jgi:hypothetical protein